MATELSSEDIEFLAKCEEELKHRFTEKDEEFMKVFNADQSNPPIVEPWWVRTNTGRRNDNRQNRRYEAYNRNRSYHDRGRRDNYDRQGYRDYDGHDDRGYGSRRQYSRY